MKDLRFTKEHAYCDFTESENDENIKSGESLGVIFGKIRRWIKSVKSSAGEKVEGKTFNVAGEEIAAKQGAEIFNDYVHNAAIGRHSTAMGFATTASGSYSFASGNNSIASGKNSFASGCNTVAEGNYSNANGCSTIAKGANSTVIGKNNVTDHDEKFAFIIGNGTANLDRSNALAIGWDGKLYFNNDTAGVDVGGWLNPEHGYLRNSFGKERTNHAGEKVISNGGLEIGGNRSIGNTSVAMGSDSLAEGGASLAAGGRVNAIGNCSSSVGLYSWSYGECSHTLGEWLVAASDNQTVIGKANVSDAENKFAFIIGNGIGRESGSDRSNAFAVDWNGNIYIGNSATGINLLDLLSRIEALEAKTELSISEISSSEIDSLF